MSQQNQEHEDLDCNDDMSEEEAPSNENESTIPTGEGDESISSVKKGNGKKRKRKENAPMKPRSKVWAHFTRIKVNGEQKGKCNYCPKTYCCDPIKNGTTSLKRHMLDCKFNPNNKNPKQSHLSLQPIGDGVETMGSLTTWKFDQDACRLKLTEMMIKDELSFRLVHGEGFISFVAALQPQFKMPSRWSVSRDCYQLYLDEKVKLREFFKKSKQTVCLTTDTWTSIQNLNYMCITAHYIDEDWSVNKKIINFCTVDSHKGEEMGRAIESCLREWGIAKVFAITVDNAKSNDTCLAYLKGRLSLRSATVMKGSYLHMRCVAHVVNLIVGDGLKEINSSIKRVREAVRYVRHSPARMARFKLCCEEESIDCKSMLCLDVCTRWNSTYLMLSVALKFEKAFDLYDIKDPHFKIDLVDGVPTFVDWEIARRMTEILEVFYDITLRVSASLHVTSNVYYHEISTVRLLLEDWVKSKDKNVKSMGQKMRLKFDKYWGNFKEMNKLIFIAVVLDPRYKLEFVEFVLQKEYGFEEGKQLALDLRFEMDELFDEYRALHLPQSDGTNNESSSRGQSPEKKPLYNVCTMGDMFKRMRRGSGDTRKNEIDVYLKEDPLDVETNDFDILKWWKLNHMRFPILSLIVRDILSMPISTVASESAFSAGSRVLDPFRSSLTPKIVEALLCAQDWLRGSNQPKSIEEDLESILQHEEGIKDIEASLSNETTMTQC